jgi:hypothetical protein
MVYRELTSQTLADSGSAETKINRRRKFWDSMPRQCPILCKRSAFVVLDQQFRDLINSEQLRKRSYPSDPITNSQVEAFKLFGLKNLGRCWKSYDCPCSFQPDGEWEGVLIQTGAVVCVGYQVVSL